MKKTESAVESNENVELPKNKEISKNMELQIEWAAQNINKFINVPEVKELLIKNSDSLEEISNEAWELSKDARYANTDEKNNKNKINLIRIYEILGLGFLGYTVEDFSSTLYKFNTDLVSPDSTLSIISGFILQLFITTLIVKRLAIAHSVAEDLKNQVKLIRINLKERIKNLKQLIGIETIEEQA